MNLPHYFIAIPLPNNLQNYLTEWQRELEKNFPYKQWTHKQDLHITLKFLGAASPQTVTQLQAELKQMEHIRSFFIQIRSIGTFGNRESPRVLWAGVKQKREIADLQRMAERCAVNQGFKEDKCKFTPHITLAKKWNGLPLADPKLENRKKEYANLKMNLHVEEVVLYRIYPEQSPKYDAVSTYALEGGGNNRTAD